MDRRQVSRGLAVAAIAMLAGSGVGCASSGTSGKGSGGAPRASEQVAFGVDMARRGLWSEALFRFEQARASGAANASVLNNLAVCYEAVGRFEDALATYREAIQIAPQNRFVKQNYTRFTEFYQSFRSKGRGKPNVLPVPPTEAPTEAPAAEPPPASPPAEPPPAQGPSGGSR